MTTIGHLCYITWLQRAFWHFLLNREGLVVVELCHQNTISLPGFFFSYKIKKRKDQMYFLIFSYLIVMGALAVYGRWPSFGQGILLAIFVAMLPT
jgi:hypothetical protein